MPKANTFVAEYHLNHGMSEEDALALLQSLTGKRDDTKARDLVNNLYRLPLGILAYVSIVSTFCSQIFYWQFVTAKCFCPWLLTLRCRLVIC